MKNTAKIMTIGLIGALLFIGMPGPVLFACDGWHYVSPLYAGQDFDNPIGQVEVIRTCGSPTMTVKYTTTGGWVINETNLAVATSFEDIPQTKSGNPKVGKFPYSSEHDPGVTIVTHVIDLNDLFNGGPYVGTIFIAAHAVVFNQCSGIEETGWADTGYPPDPPEYMFPGNSWALYFTIVLC